MTASAALAGALLVLAAPAALAAEPPAYPQAPTRREEFVEPPQWCVDLSLQAAWAQLGDWGDAVGELESRSVGDGLTIPTSNRPAYTFSFEGALLIPARGRWLLGFQYDRPTGKSEFTVRDNNSGVGGSGEFRTRANATSNAYLGVVRWLAPSRAGAVHSYLQLGVGVGSGRLEFTTPSGSAIGKGHGLAANLEAGAYVGDGVVRVRTAVGYRHHRAPLAYSRVTASSQSGLNRYYFDFADELRSFAHGRDLDLSGLFARLGATASFSR